MSGLTEAQEAKVSVLCRRVRDFSRFSISSVRSPVSIALELATALRMLARETVTLAECLLRTMGRLQGKITMSIVTSTGCHALNIAHWGSGESRIRKRPCQALADKLGIDALAIRQHLDRLEAAGAIERMDGTRGDCRVKV